MTRPVQPRSLSPAEQRARATRPDLWPAFQPPVFPERTNEREDDQDLDED